MCVCMYVGTNVRIYVSVYLSDNVINKIFILLAS